MDKEELIEEGKKSNKKRGRPMGTQKIDKVAILNIAIQEFADKGFEGTKQRDIAQKAKITISLINYHFKNKERLWQQAVLQLVRKLKPLFEEINRNFKDLEGVPALKVYTRQLVYFSARYPKFYKIVFHEMCNKTERTTWLIKHFLEPTYQFIEKGITNNHTSSKVFKNYPIANLSSIIIGATNVFFVHAFQMEYMYGIYPFDEQQIEKHADIVIDLLFAKF